MPWRMTEISKRSFRAYPLMAGIAFKLGTLLIRQLSKPVANEFKRAATGSEVFRKFCVQTGNAMNTFTTRVNISFMGHKSNEVKPLAETVAVAKGAEILGEAIVFAIGGSVIYWEMARQSAKSTREKKDKERRQHVKEMLRHAQFEKLEEDLAIAQAKIASLEDLVATMVKHQQSHKK